MNKEIITIDSEGIAVYQKTAAKTILSKKRQKIINSRTVLGLDILPKFRNLDDFIFPTGIKLLKDNGYGRKVFIIEEPPIVRTTFWNKEWVAQMSDEDPAKPVKNSFSLAFPYVIYFITFDKKTFCNLQIFYRTQPLVSIKDFLFKPNLPNIEGSPYSVCMGGAYFNREETYARQIREIIKSFWSSEFNTDMTGCFDHYRVVDELSDLWTWEEESKKNPLFPLKICWAGEAEPIDYFAKLALGGGKGRFRLPDKQEHVFAYFKKAILSAPLAKKKREVKRTEIQFSGGEIYYNDKEEIIGFTENGESFFVGDILNHSSKGKCVISGFKRCGSSAGNDCSPGRSCPYMTFKGIDGTYCIFSGHAIEYPWSRE